MIYSKEMLCKHFKGKTLFEKNIYRIVELGLNGSDIDVSKVTYSGDGILSNAKNLVLYENIFQGKFFAREYEDISSELSAEKQKMFNQTLKVEPLTDEEIKIVLSNDFAQKKQSVEHEKYKI